MANYAWLHRHPDICRLRVPAVHMPHVDRQPAHLFEQARRSAA
jgi:hypothetical protein